MKIIKSENVKVVKCPRGGFISNRYLLEKDGMGFTVTQTFIPKGKPQFWHYKNHLEACLCIKGRGTLVNASTGDVYKIKPGVMYVLDNNDAHFFKAISDVTLVCVFNPPLVGDEIHNQDGSYERREDAI